ncbi:hypothetical protein DFH06DRAFT_1385682 [Mycena polygramma]|nr:hypothetical protein DFH06DRAFT_1385682 [Mycena polygramma]
MSGVPPSKRKRTDEDSPEPAAATTPGPVRSKIWKPYGDIILEAESTQFRINRDTLAQYSSVFRDMFGVPQPPNEPTIEGCAIDWQLLLEMFYDPFMSGNALSVDLLAAMLRLGRKYEITTAKEDAVQRIEYEYPASLDAWDKVATNFTKIRSRSGCQVDLLRLAVERGIFSSIPALAYCCLHAWKLELLLTDQVERDDETFVSIPNNLKLTLAIAAERMQSWQKQIFKWLEDAGVVPHASCRSPALCTQQRHALHCIFSFGEEDAHFHCLTNWVQGNTWSSRLCRICEPVARTRFNSDRHKTWDALPGFFELPMGEELKNPE